MVYSINDVGENRLWPDVSRVAGNELRAWEQTGCNRRPGGHGEVCETAGNGD